MVGSALKALGRRQVGDRRAVDHQAGGGDGRVSAGAGRDTDKPFLMPIEDVFSISGRGTVVTGRVERGIVIKVGEGGDCGDQADPKTICTGVEMFRKLLDQGRRETTWACCCAEPSVTMWRGRGTGEAEVDNAAYAFGGGGVRSEQEEGGRHTPFFNNYRPQFYFRTTDVTGALICRKVWRW